MSLSLVELVCSTEQYCTAKSIAAESIAAESIAAESKTAESKLLMQHNKYTKQQLDHDAL